MKRLFNKSNATPTPYYQEETNQYPSTSSNSKSNTKETNRQSYRDEEDYIDHKSRGLKRSGSNSNHARRNELPTSRSQPQSPGIGKVSSRAGKTGLASAAYPSYGEIQLDTNENRGGGGFVVPSSTDPGEAVYHQKLPARANISTRPAVDDHRHHSRTQSNVSNERGDQASRIRVDPQFSDPLPNPFSTKDAGKAERKASISKSQGATLNRLRSTSGRRNIPPQELVSDGGGDRNEKPTRRPSLLYGIDSGVHGGFASAAMMNASEQENKDGSPDQRRGDRDGDVMKAESRYVDRYVDFRTPQSVAIGAGMDKMKKLFARRNKREDRVQASEEDDRERESSGDWTRVETSRPFDSSEAMNRLDGSRERYDTTETSTPNEHVQSAMQWLNSKKVAHLNNKQTEGAITSHIGLLCIQDEYDWDWSQVEALIHLTSHSELASKEAARALRKEFKYGEEEPRYRAVRLWAIVCLKASDRFRLQVANKKFLDVLEDLYTDKKTSTKVQGRLLVAWSMLAWEYQSDQDLRPITKVFNKIKPNDMPFNGITLDPDNELFNPSRINSPPTQNNYAMITSQEETIIPRQYIPKITPAAINISDRQQSGQQRDYSPPQTTITTTTTTVQTTSLPRPVSLQAGTPGQQTPEEASAPSRSDEIRRMHQECQVAKSNAQLMTEALIEHGLHSDLVVEFAAKTQLSQDYILAQIPWASSQADQSREDNADNEEFSGKSTEEENLLGDLLDTHEKLVAANGLMEEARKREREEEEEREIINRSMREQRIDRSGLVQDPTTGNLFPLQGDTNNRNLDTNLISRGLAVPSDQAQASGSRSPSPNPPSTRRPLPVPGAPQSAQAELKPPMTSAPMQKSISAASQGASVAGTGLPSVDGSSTLAESKSISALQRSGGPRSMNNNSPFPAKLSLADDRYPPSLKGIGGSSQYQQQQQDEDEDSDDSIIKTPIAPSAKALGKRRAVSIYEGLSPTKNGMGNGNSQDVEHLSTHAEAIQLESSPSEEALRARPPPALPPTNPYRQMVNP